MNMKWTMKHNKIHMKHKKHTCYTHNHMNLMKQSYFLSLILGKNIQCQVPFPQYPRSSQPTPKFSVFTVLYILMPLSIHFLLHRLLDFLNARCPFLCARLLLHLPVFRFPLYIHAHKAC